MRISLYAVAALALVAIVSPGVVRSGLVSAASALVESTPFLLGGIVAARIFSVRSDAMEYFGCGCGFGPSARSLPATAATWLVFGPLVAGARFAAACLVSHLLRGHAPHQTAPSVNLLAELEALLPAVLLAGAAMQLFAALSPARIPVVVNAIAGAAFGFVAAPCALGVVALAGALHARAPEAAAAFLCVAGIVDHRALRRRPRRNGEHDFLAYALLTAALGIVAARHGDALLHPAFTPLIACCAFATACLAVVHRHSRSGVARAAPSLMLFAALVGASPPQYHVTETTLSELFTGEQLSFTGVSVRDGATAAIVRYAITCCRADAAPVAVRLERAPPFRSGTWLHVNGTVESDAFGKYVLRASRIEPIVPPVDPFIYR